MLPNHQSATENATHAGNVFDASKLNTKAAAHGDSEIRLQFMRAITGGATPRHNSATLDLTNTNLEEDYDVTAADTSGHGLNTFPDLLGIGADYSNSVGQTQNFVNQDYELKIESGVQTGRATLPASRRGKNEVQETFFRNVSLFNLKSLVATM